MKWSQVDLRICQGCKGRSLQRSWRLRHRKTNQRGITGEKLRLARRKTFRQDTPRKFGCCVLR